MMSRAEEVTTLKNAHLLLLRQELGRSWPIRQNHPCEARDKAGAQAFNNEEPTPACNASRPIQMFGNHSSQ
jgi:hypothetical protein